MATYAMSFGYMPQQQTYSTPQQAYLPQQTYGPVAYSPNYTGGMLFGYANNPYGLYGQNSSLVLAETPYARLTGQYTQLSSAAIPNLSTYLQPMFVDMNAFLGNKNGIPMNPSFIGSTAMQNADKPLYQTYQQYLSQNQPPQFPPSYGYQQQQFAPNTGYAPQPFVPMMAPNVGYQQQSYGFAQQGYGYSQQGYGYSQQSYGYAQSNPFAQMPGPFPGTFVGNPYQGSVQQNNFCCCC